MTTTQREINEIKYSSQFAAIYELHIKGIIEGRTLYDTVRKACEAIDMPKDHIKAGMKLYGVKIPEQLPLYANAYLDGRIFLHRTEAGADKNKGPEYMRLHLKLVQMDGTPLDENAVFNWDGW